MNPLNRTHSYRTHLRWTGNLGTGTSHYRDYTRDHEVTGAGEGKPVLLASSDPTFRGDPSRYNPEELLVASLSGCHMLWYLHLCAVAGVVVVNYTDEAEGTMVETDSGHFTDVTLRPTVIVTPESDRARGQELHKEAHRLCFIANSVNFDVRCEPKILTQSDID